MKQASANRRVPTAAWNRLVGDDDDDADDDDACLEFLLLLVR